MPRIVIASLTLALVGALSACKALSPEEELRFLFRGFTLLGAGAVSDEIHIVDVGLSKLRNPITSGASLTPGHGYVFRKETPWRNQTLGVVIFPERLRKIGARVTKAPQADNELMVAVIGGPYFFVDFEKDGHSGTILNRLVQDEVEGPLGSEVTVLVYR